MTLHRIHSRTATILAAALALLAAVGPAAAVTIGDITRIEGQRVNKLHGLGLVVGLPGTGDGGDYRPAIRPLAALLERLNDPVASPVELEDTQNVALVTVTATIPEEGVRPGDRLDVQVQSIGAAKSLEGGRLFITPLQGPQPGSVVYALAEGRIRIENPDTPTVGVVDGGAVMEEEVLTTFVEDGSFRLVIKESSAGFIMAAQIAKEINDRTEHWVGHRPAEALDAKSIRVEVPEFHRASPVEFVAYVLQRQILMPEHTEARVEINERTGTIVISGDVEISPSVVSHKSLVVSTQTVGVPPSAANQQTGAGGGTMTSFTSEEGPFFGLDTQGQGGTRLQDLVSALNVLKVPAEDRIAIVKLLADAGRIHADVHFVE